MKYKLAPLSGLALIQTNQKYEPAPSDSIRDINLHQKLPQCPLSTIYGQIS